MSIKSDKEHTYMRLAVSNILDVSRKSKKNVFDHVAFAVFLRTARKNTKPYLNQSDLAKLAGIVRQRISELEGGDKALMTKLPTQPSLDLVEKIAQVLSININDAREAAGYSRFFVPFPVGLDESDFSGLDENDISKLKTFLRALKLEKEEKHLLKDTQIKEKLVSVKTPEAGRSLKDTQIIDSKKSSVRNKKEA